MFSVAFTRMYSFRSLKSLVEKHPSSNMSVLIDDTSMFSRGASCDAVLNILVPAMLSFQKQVGKLKLRLSLKAVIVSSSLKLTNLLTKELAIHKLVFTKAKHARDLGISHSCGKRTLNSILSDRMAKSKARMKKISKLAVLNRRARKLFTGSAFAMATWGHQAAAISDAKMLELERDALSCSGINPAGRCRTIGLVVAYGVQGTLRAGVVRETMRAWFSLHTSY